MKVACWGQKQIFDDSDSMNKPRTSIESMTPTPAEIDSTDAQLLARFVDQRDQEAFASLLHRHGRMVLGVCRRILGRYQDAEDAFQATFLSLAEEAARIARPELLANWLYTVARRSAIRLKKVATKRRRMELQREQQMNTNSESLPHHGEIWSDLAPVLDGEIGRLADDLRVIVILCDVEGKTRKEAARQLGCPEATVSTRLMKARSLLAQRLSRRGIVLSTATLGMLLSQHAASAAVPASLVATTLQTASMVSVGQTVSAATASPQVIALAKGTWKSMLLANLKTVAVAVVLVVTVGLGMQIQQAKQTDEQKAVGAANVPVDLSPAIQKALENNAAQLNPIAISFTKQVKSRLPAKETFERLKISKMRYSRVFLEEETCRTVLQDGKFYTCRKGIDSLWGTGRPDRMGHHEIARQVEASFDGNIVYNGYREERSKESFLGKVLNDNLAARNHPTALDSFYDRFFDELIGLTFPPQGENTTSRLQAESSVLRYLQRGGKLESVSDVDLGGRRLLRVALRIANLVKTRADQTDVEQERDTLSVGEGFHSPAGIAQLIDNILAERNLPATKRVVFYLDPELHYAVRQSEEWYDPDTLLLRCVCSDFEQLSDRQVWLPRKYEVDFHSYSTAPGVIFSEPFLSKVVLVTELSGQRIPNEQFVLNDTEPGILINDDTAPDSALTSDQRTQSKFHYKTGRTPEETGRNIEEGQKRAAAEVPTVELQTAPPAPRVKSAFRWVLIANGIALVLTAGFFAYRRFRAS